MSAPVDVSTRTLPDRVARAATEVFAPAVWAAVMPLVAAIHASRSWLVGLGWGLVGVLFCSAIPYGIIWLGVRRGRLTDHHIGVREQRRAPLLYGLLSVVAGLTLLVTFGAPQPLVAMVVVMSAVLLAVTLVNQMWKLSAHAAVISGSTLALVVVLGPWLLPTLLLVPLVGWSRVRLGDHTIGQVVSGTVVGILVGLPVFLLLT